MTTPADSTPHRTLRVLICDGEPLARRALVVYLRDVGWVEVLGEADEGNEANRMIHQLEPDVVFVDARLPGLAAVEVLDPASHHPAVVFTTPYDEYVVTGFESRSAFYLVKPFGLERLREMMERVRRRLAGEESS